DADPPLGVELAIVRPGDVVVGEADHARFEPILGEDALLQPAPRPEWVGVETMAAAVRELGDDEALFLEPGERLPEAGWDGDPPLVVHHVLEVSANHPTGRGRLPPKYCLHRRHAPPSPPAAAAHTPRPPRPPS